MSTDKFVHLHVHSHYSILDGMSKVPALIEKCMKNGMHSMALTDHGNMYGIKDLVDSAASFNSKPKKKVAECEEEIAKEKSVIESVEKTEEDKAKARKHLAELESQLPELKQKAESFIPFKPIIGIETYCAHESYADENLPGHKKHRGWHLILLAKNMTGYKSLCKLSSIAFTEGYYYNARISHDLLEKYHEGVICSSACLGGEIPQKILEGDLKGAEESVVWFKNLFGDDYYIELQRHKTDKPNANTETYYEQEKVNKILIELARKYNIKIIATNDVHFVEEDHGEAHDRLICLSTGKDFDDPNRMHYTKQEWLKSPEEMEAIFSDIPEALSNTLEISDKIEIFSIDSGPIMPKFPIPEDFGTEEEYKKKFSEKDLFDEFTQNEKGEVVLSQEDAEKKIKKLGGYEKLYRIKLEADYLSKLAWEGAKKRYGENLTDEQRERIIFELHIMKTMGFPGYFLIVQDYIRAAREELGVSVGPGRGSAAGSVVAYCLKITDIDPLKYDLLFERFLNPDRISLPDIDVDFDDDGRGKVLDWVTQKYGFDHVAHIITYGTMAAKSAIADVGRVQKVPLSVVNEIKSFVPERSFDEEQVKAVEGSVPKKMPKVNLKNCYKYVKELKQYLNSDDENVSTMLTYAEELEDTNRQTGIHACGVIIGADDLTKFAPVCTIKDKDSGKDVVVTQYDGHVVESVGLIKMDFLGLKTLSLIKEAISNIKKSKGEDVDIDNIPINDELTYKLFSDGKTIGTFQFESPGMQKYLRDLKPTQITDLIAMNALYRPGPMDNIPSFIARKQGKEEIKYVLPCMEKYLKDTYGITVYQEQVMLLSREIADFTRGQSDTLRKAMGKKQIAKMEELFGLYMKNGVKKQHKENPNLSEEQVTQMLKDIWEEWKKFASYAFNKSHAACYGWVAYQTGYLKAHYPAEYMAANLTRNKDSITDVSKFMDECKSMGIAVKGPNVNESELNFTVNKKGEILFGLGGVKGVGEGPVEAIVSEREKNGPFKGIFDFIERVNLSTCNRKAIESLALAGAFDCLGDIRREQFFAQMKNSTETGSEALTRYGNKYQSDKQQTTTSLFGDLSLAVEIAKPVLPVIDNPWSDLERLNKEKDVVGIYLTSHPLDGYKFQMKYIVNTQLSDLAEDNLHNIVGRNFIVGGIVTSIRNGITKKGSPYMVAKVEDFEGGVEFALFSKEYTQFSNLFVPNSYVCIHGTVDTNKWDSNKYVKNINKVEYLSDVIKPGHIKGVNIQLPYKSVNQILLSDLKSLLSKGTKEQNQENNLKVPLHIELIDEANSRNVKLFSRMYYLELGTELMNFINNYEDIQMSLIN